LGTLLEKGIVIKSTGSQYWVKMDDGSTITCGLKGKMRQEEIRSTNPIAVGDFVFVDSDDEGGKTIDSVADRKNYIVRRSPNLSKQVHILAANVDQAILVATINYPLTTSVFIDRFIASAEAYRIPVVLVFNKIDRYDKKHMDELDRVRSMYESIGYPTIAVSAKKSEDLDVVKNLLKDKVSALAGHSGVGKSTLINRIEPGLNLKTAEISAYHQQGRHTTSFAEMHQLSFGGYIIDTPGIRGFGLIDIEKEEISHFFRDIFEVSKHCQFNNCLHQREPGCAVKVAVEEGRIALSRYQSYLNILTNNDEKYR
jgi:ribosome biogenesis GTPase